MFEILKASERGQTRVGWLNSRHSFSFGQYFNPDQMGFRTLRVINDDIVTAGAGFGEHPHRDMEIISYVVEGALEHRDSLGNGSVIRPGDVQIMSAGTGIRHAEFNASKQEHVRFLQIWIPPNRSGIEPRYDQKRFPLKEEPGRLHLLLSPDAEGDSLPLHQDVRLYGGRFHQDDATTHTFRPGRHGWIQIVTGSVSVGQFSLSEGDGLAISEEEAVHIHAGQHAELLLFDLP